MTPNRKPTIEDVARRAGVSLMTVSRVVNNAASVKESTQKKVRKAIAEVGYQQNEAGRLLRGSRAKTIGIIVPDISDIFFSACAHVIQQIARSHQYMTLVVSSERDESLELREAELMANRKVAGLIVATSVLKASKRLRSLQAEIPLVAFDRPFAGVNTDAVLVENQQGAQTAVEHLIDHGHSKIACVGYDEAVHPVRERIEGYTAAMHAAKLKPLIFSEMPAYSDVLTWATKIATMKDRPTAVFSLNHRTSTHIYRAFSAIGLSVPGDIALIGFDDFDLAEMLVSPLTVIAQSPAEMARRAASLLFEQIHAGQREGLPAKIFLPVELKIRASCGCNQ